MCPLHISEEYQPVYLSSITTNRYKHLFLCLPNKNSLLNDMLWQVLITRNWADHLYTVRLLFLRIWVNRADRSSVGMTFPTSERTCIRLSKLMRSLWPLNHTTLVELTYASRLLEQNAIFVKVRTYKAESVQGKHFP